MLLPSGNPIKCHQEFCLHIRTVLTNDRCSIIILILKQGLDACRFFFKSYMAANPACGQLNGKSNIFLVRSRLRLRSHETGSAVPPGVSPLILPTRAESDWLTLILILMLMLMVLCSLLGFLSLSATASI